MHRVAIFITDFGDSGVTVPLAAVTMAILLAGRRFRLALLWGGSVAFCAGVTAALKLVLAACAHPLARIGLNSPSGHVAMSAMVYGGFVVLLGAAPGPAGRRAAQVAAAVLVGAIAVTRVTLHDHSVAEAAVGLAVGLAALAAFRALRVRAPAARPPARGLCIAALVTIALMHGASWPAERAIHGLAASHLLHALLPWCG